MEFDEPLFSGASTLIHQAINRHALALPFIVEAIDLGHRAFVRLDEQSRKVLPGEPSTRRVRTDINDNIYRYLRSIGEPLIETGIIREIPDTAEGEFIRFPDGLWVRIKKSDRMGRTSNITTDRIERIARRATQYALDFADPPIPLDELIADDVGLDVVYIPGLSHGEYRSIGIKLAVTDCSAVIDLDEATPDALYQISPAAAEVAKQIRQSLAG